MPGGFLEADLSLMMQTSEFAIAVTIDGRQANAIFDAAYVDASGVATAEPVLTARSVDVAHTRNGRLCVVNGQSYRISRLEPDGTGVTRLILERQ